MLADRQLRRSLARAALLLAALLPLAGLAACGPAGGGEPPAGVQLLVTDDFGAQQLAAPQPPKVAEGDTVLRLLQRNVEVETKFGGGFVAAIAGQPGSVDGERTVDWFFYAGGVLSDRGPAGWKLSGGDRIWWDRHRWDHASVGAVVGQFPAPMRGGSGGRFAGAQLICRGAQAACAVARERLAAAGVQEQAGDEATQLLVGPWSQLRSLHPELASLQRGPKRSGVFARVDRRGIVTPLDADARPLEPEPRSGLIAAISRSGRSPLWVITGPSDAAVERAAGQLDEASLAGRFAVIARPGGAAPLPATEGDGQ